LLLRDPKAYETRVKEYVRRFASAANGPDTPTNGQDNDSDVSSINYYSDDETGQLEL